MLWECDNGGLRPSCSLSKGRSRTCRLRHVSLLLDASSETDFAAASRSADSAEIRRKRRATSEHMRADFKHAKCRKGTGTLEKMDLRLDGPETHVYIYDKA